jgi:class 3 adenylate cyclase
VSVWGGTPAIDVWTYGLQAGRIVEILPSIMTSRVVAMLCSPRGARMLLSMFHHPPSRGLITVLFTDITSSTEVVVQLGDRRWRVLQSRHHAEIRRELKRHGGHEVDTAGDGFLATFSSPAAGVRCAFAIVKAIRKLGLEVRAGLHIGEAELTGEKVSGIAVPTAARVSALAGPGQVFVTSTIVQMVAGANLEFTGVGTQQLKGVPGTWELFSLAAVDGQPIGMPLDPRDAAETRDRSSPPETREEARLRAILVGIGIVSVVVLAGVLFFERGRQGSTVTPPASTAAPMALVALRDGSGADAFPIDLPALRTGYLVGPMLLTGRVDTPSGLAWLPFGYRTYELHVAQINRTSGAVVDPGSGYFFNTKRTTCVCMAAMGDQIWTPIATGKSPVGTIEGSGVSLRGIGLEGGSTTDIVVDGTLVSGGITALVSGGGYLWVGDSTYGRVYRVDPRTSAVKQIGLRQSADVLAFEDGSLFVLDTLEGKITRVDPSTGHSLPSFTISGDQQGMAVGGGYLWVTDASGTKVERIREDLESSTPIPVGQFGGSPKGIAYAGDAIVVGFTGGTVAKINPSDPASPALIWTRPGLGLNGSSITIDRDIVWAGGGTVTNY